MRECQHCGQHISPKRRRDAIYCSNRCAHAQANIAWRERHPERKKEQALAWRNRNLDKARAYYYENREKLIGDAQKWVKKNRDKRRTYIKAHYAANKGYYLHNARLRKRAVRRATPGWLSKEHRQEISVIYDFASGIGHHVDHIVPLQGKNVCGLHVPWNLQVIPATKNRAKSNRHAA